MADLDGRCFVRDGNALRPADVAASEWLGDIPLKREVIIEARFPRSPQFHRWFFALLTLVLDGAGLREKWPTPDFFLDALKLAVGHVKTVVTLDGEVELHPDSIAIPSLSGDKFARFVRRVCWVIHDRYGLDTELLMAEVDAEQRTKLVTKLKLNRKPEADE